MKNANERPDLYGIMAEFTSPDALLHAVREARDAGFQRMDAYSPFPVEGLADALGFERTWVSPVVLLGGIIGGIGGFALQYWVSVMAYPINVGGRPLNTWPMFVPVTFETKVLVSGLFAVLGMLALNGLPEPYHPTFHVPRFQFATSDRFFLLIESTDPIFDYKLVREFLQALKPREVNDVPH